MRGHKILPPPPDRNSFSELQHYLQKHGALTPRRLGKGARDERDRRDRGLELLYVALNSVRTYAYPGDRPDWTAFRSTSMRLRLKGGPQHFKPRITASPGFWRFNGPKDLGGGNNDVSGRVNAIAVDPTDSNVMYAGAAGGGVWKTADGGVNWTPLSNAWPFEAVSSIAIDPSDPMTVYVGTGDFQAWSVQSFGLMKSVDGGNTFANFAVAEAGETSISSIVVDPDQSNIVSITSGRGRQRYGQVWRSVDRGLHWTPVIQELAEWAEVSISQPDNTGTRLYYAVGWNQSGGLMYRSSDRGATWEQINVPWGAGQFGISVAPSAIAAKSVYVLAGADMKVFSSSNSGDTWTDITANLTQNQWDWNQLWYDWYLRCSSLPGTQVDQLFLGLKHVFTWDAQQELWAIVPSGHDDQHCLTVDPADAGHVFLGNDGGTWSLTFDANKKQWSTASLNANLGITQLYKAGFSPQDRRIMLAGAQDNNLDSAQGDLDHWSLVGLPRSGDIIAANVNQADKRVQFSAVGVEFYGIVRTDNQWSNYKEITPTPQGDYVDPFSTILALDDDGIILYWGTDYLWMWEEGTQTWTSHLGGQRLASGHSTSVRAIGVAPSDSLRVYTGSNDGQVWMGQGRGWAWVQIDSGQTPLPNRVVTAISVNPRDPNDIIVAVGGTGTGHIWRCADTKSSSRTWVDVSGGNIGALPDVPINAIARHPLDPARRLFAATDLGVFESDDAGATWHDITIGYGLPRVPVTDLAVTECYLHATTFGRGVWTAHLEFTDVAPAATSVDDIIFVVAKGISGRIFICQAKFGNAFSEWREIAGGGRTDAAPAVTTVEKSVFVFVKGLNGHIYLNQAELTAATSDPDKFAQAFSGWFEVQGNGVTDAAPTAATIGNHVFVFVKGLNNRIYVNQADLGHAFGNWLEVQGDGLTDAAPSAAVIQETIFVFVKGLDGRIYLNQADLGHAFGYWFEVQGNGLTGSAPAAASIQDSVFVFVKGLDGRIYLNQAEYRHTFSGWFEVQGMGVTDAAPGAGTVLVSLFAFVKGLDGSPYVNQAEYRHAFSGWFPMSNDTP